MTDHQKNWAITITIDCKNLILKQKNKKDKIIIPNSFNPIPYQRLTQGSLWTKNAKRYKAWKLYILQNFIEQIGCEPFEILKNKIKYRILVKIVYKDKTHGDSDNISKAIWDSIFINGKQHKTIGKKIINLKNKKPTNIKIKNEIKDLQKKLEKQTLDDKYVYGAHDYSYDKNNPKVEIVIYYHVDDNKEIIYNNWLKTIKYKLSELVQKIKDML